MRGAFIAFLVLIAIVLGGGAIAQTAYNAGLSTALTTAQAAAPAGEVVIPAGIPPYGYGYGWGWHGAGWGGPGILGFFGFLLVLFVVIGLIRAIVGGGRGHRGGWGGPGGPGRSWRDEGWPSDHVRQRFEEMHRSAHASGEDSADRPPSPAS